MISPFPFTSLLLKLVKIRWAPVSSVWPHLTGSSSWPHLKLHYTANKVSAAWGLHIPYMQVYTSVRILATWSLISSQSLLPHLLWTVSSLGQIFLTFNTLTLSNGRKKNPFVYSSFCCCSFVVHSSYSSLSYFCLKIVDLLEQLALSWRGLLKCLKACGQSCLLVGVRQRDRLNRFLYQKGLWCWSVHLCDTVIHLHLAAPASGLVTLAELEDIWVSDTSNNRESPTPEKKHVYLLSLPLYSILHIISIPTSRPSLLFQLQPAFKNLLTLTTWTLPVQMC